MRSATPLLARLLTLSLLLAVLAAACSEAAEFIPGDAPAPTVSAEPSATPAAVAAPPILPPGSVRVAGSTPKSEPDERTPDAELARTVVQLQFLGGGGAEDGTMVRTGSGVIVDRAQRLILTSYVLANPYNADGTPAYSTITVGVTRFAGDEPSVEFEAEIVDASPELGLAVLRAARRLDGDAIEAGEFNLPAAQQGDPDTLKHGDALRLFGHPGPPPGEEAGSQAIQAVVVATAEVTGFRGDEEVGGRAWLNTDARLPYGAAGGPVFDAAGGLVGITTQLRYDPLSPVGQVRSVALAAGLIERARTAGPEARFAVPLRRQPGPVLGEAAPDGDGVVVGAPAFAENAVESRGALDLFDYTSIFLTRPRAFYYEYAAQGIDDGAEVEERWHLEGMLQDTLSLSYVWDRGRFDIVTRGLEAPSAAGMPAGMWRLEIWVDGVLRSSSLARVVVELPADPGIGELSFGASASPEHAPATPPSAEAAQLLAFFDYHDAAAVRLIRWIVFRDGQVVYQSPTVPWRGGNEGTWWIGYGADGPLGPGFWEFEIYHDGPDVDKLEIRGAGGVQLY